MPLKEKPPLSLRVLPNKACTPSVGYRDVKFAHIIAAVTPNFDALAGNRDWVKEYSTALRPHSAEGCYMNFLMDEGEDRIASCYLENYNRLGKIKAQYDPSNLFQMNQNIKPRD